MFSAIAILIVALFVAMPVNAQEATREADTRSDKRSVIQQKRDEVSDRIKNARENAQSRVQEIKDASKRQAVETISIRITSSQQKWLGHWNNVLSRLSGIVTKIEARFDIDTTSANAAIARAEEAVAVQSKKTYAIDFESEETLRADVGALIKEFKSDMQSVRQAVDNAREEIASLIRQIKSNE